jgi:Glu-tRNAGln amidotransferase C subunit
MRSDPLDVVAAIRLSKATVTKMKQNLFWAAIYNLIAIPVAAGVLSPFGILLAPEVGALAMSASSLTVATNAVLLKSVEKKLSSQVTGLTNVTRDDTVSAPLPQEAAVGNAPETHHGYIVVDAILEE